MAPKNIFLKDVRAIFFDAGGTLLYPHPSVGEIYARVAGDHGVNASSDFLNQVFHEVWNQKDGLSMVAFTDEKSEKNWWREIVREVFSRGEKFNDFEHFFDDLYDQFASPQTWKLFDETHAVLEHFKKRGFVIGMISNWDRRLLHLCDAFDIKKYFDFVLISALFGKAKPHRDIFSEALRLSGVRPNEALHVGDSLEDDVQGAMESGIRALWLNRHAREHKHSHAISMISNLREMIV